MLIVCSRLMTQHNIQRAHFSRGAVVRMQQEQAQLSVLELEPLLELVDADIRVQEVEDKAFFPLLQAMQPPLLPLVSRPLELYVLTGQFAIQNEAPGNEVLPEGQ